MQHAPDIFSWRRHWAHKFGPAPVLPTTREAMEQLGWDSCDIVIVTGEDRPGIIRRLTTCLAEKAINIEDWDCRFDGPNVTYIGELTVPEHLAIRPVQEELQAVMADLGMRCTFQHENIFRATNEIGPIRALLKEGRRA